MAGSSPKAAGALVALAFLTSLDLAWLHAQAPTRNPQVVQLTPMEALKLNYQRGQYDKARQLGYAILWNEMDQPEALYYLAASLEKLKDNDQAAAFAHVLQRVLAEPKFKDFRQAQEYGKWCQGRLETLDADFRQAQKTYLAAAAGKRFTSPEKADDLWMTHATLDLHNLHGLYAWKLVGGRKDAAKDWIHNLQGQMHRSGGKLMDEVHGRKGVLFAIPNKKSHRLSRMLMTNPGQGRFLRIGVRGYGFAFLLNVVAGEKQVFSKTIGVQAWEDLKIDLGPPATGPAPPGAPAAAQGQLVLELVVPEEQRWSEGAFFDYVDFFED